MQLFVMDLNDLEITNYYGKIVLVDRFKESQQLKECLWQTVQWTFIVC